VNCKRIVRRVLNKIGCDIYKIQFDKEYTACPPYGYATYSPWFEHWFQQIYDKIKDYTVVKEDRCYIVHKFCLHCLRLEGDFAECGVYKGGTAFLIAYTLESNPIQNKQLHLFDTFSGMPATAERDPSVHKRGDLGDVSLNIVRDYLRMFRFVFFHPGLIPKTFEAVKDGQFAFVHIDVDLRQTTNDCLSFFYDRMVRGAVMISDGYGFAEYEFAKKQAVDDFFSDKPETPISLRTGQCIVIKS